ncbi:MAG: AAA family ATPase [Flavobacteriales bacterium]|nr:AAA family ATPase [Flavobacteriales bacterium]
MLKSLFISNYALIDEVQLNFHKGMTAITGETGSGKSILLGAFGMLLGERADSKSIRDEKQKCIVEAIFDLKGYGLKNSSKRRILTMKNKLPFAGKYLLVVKAEHSSMIRQCNWQHYAHWVKRW